MQMSSLIPTRTFLRFLAVGAANTAVGITSMLVLIEWAGCGYWVGTLAGNTAGAAVSYLLNRSFTFASKKPVAASLPRFAAVIAGCYLLSYSLSSTAVGVCGLSVDGPISASGIAALLGACIYTVANDWGQKLFVF